MYAIRTFPPRTLLRCCLTALLLFSTAANCQEPEEQADKYLIIHADDAGMSHSVNVGTIEGLKSGLVTSASIMVPCPWFSEFAKYCRENPDGDYGIHLTLNSEWTYYRWGPVAGRQQVPSLVDPDGYLWDNVSQVAQNAKTEDVRTELKAQIDRAKQFGIPLSHLDTHMGALFSRPDLVQVYLELGVEYDLPVLFLDMAQSPIAQEYPALASIGKLVQRQLDKHNLPVLDNIGQFYGGDSHQQRRETYIDFLRTLPAGTSELIIHCGFDNEELQGITSSASRRNGDRLIFTDPDIQRLIDDLNIKLITWKQLRAMNAPGQE